MKVKSICKHRVLAGFITFFLIITLILGGIFLSAKLGILGGKSIKDIMYSSGMDKLFVKLCDDLFDEEMKKQKLEWLVENDSYDDIKSEVVNVLMDALFEKNADVNLDAVVDKIMILIEETSTDVVDDVFDEIENAPDNFDARNNEEIKGIIEKYNLDVDDSFYDEINKYAKDAENLEQYREEIMETVDTEVKKVVDEGNGDFKAQLEKSFDEMLDEYYNSEAFVGIDMINGYLEKGYVIINLITYSLLGVSIVFMVILCALYKKSIFGALSKFAWAFGIAGIMVLSIGVVKFFVDAVVKTVLRDELANVEGIDVMSYIKIIVDSIFNPFLYVGGVFMGIMVISIIMWKITKNSFRNRAIANTRGYNSGLVE